MILGEHIIRVEFEVYTYLAVSNKIRCYANFLPMHRRDYLVVRTLHAGGESFTDMAAQFLTSALWNEVST